MNTEPLISVIIPTYNRAHCILDAVATAANQTHRNIEIVVVDDGSTDDTVAKLSEYRHTEPRLKILQQPTNQGVSAARNRGIDAAEGDYIALLDSDDIWDPRKLELQLKEIQAAPAGELTLCACRTTINHLNENGIVTDSIGTNLTANRLNSEFITPYPSTWLVPRETFDRVGSFDPDLSCSEDHEWVIRFKKEGGKFCLVEERLIEYFLKKHAQYRNMAEAVNLVMQKHGEWLIEHHFFALVDLLKEARTRGVDSNNANLVEVADNHLNALPERKTTTKNIPPGTSPPVPR